MREADIHRQLTEIFRDTLDEESLVLSAEMTTRSLSGWDWIAHVRIVVAVEARFKIKFTVMEMGKAEDVGALQRLIGEKVARLEACEVGGR